MPEYERSDIVLLDKIAKCKRRQLRKQGLMYHEPGRDRQACGRVLPGLPGRVTRATVLWFALGQQS